LLPLPTTSRPGNHHAISTTISSSRVVSSTAISHLNCGWHIFSGLGCRTLLQNYDESALGPALREVDNTLVEMDRVELFLYPPVPLICYLLHSFELFSSSLQSCPLAKSCCYAFRTIRSCYNHGRCTIRWYLPNPRKKCCRIA
jgi:hypothetical protein